MLIHARTPFEQEFYGHGHDVAFEIEISYEIRHPKKLMG